VEAFTRLGKSLVIIGEGEMYEKLLRKAGPNIKMLGRVGHDTLREYYARCRALIFPGEEDFGIVPLEAMASGRPVIALGRGGALETVVPGQTGILFEEASADALIEAILEFERTQADFSPDQLVKHAARFDRGRFRREFRDFVDGVLGASSGSCDGRPVDHRHTEVVGGLLTV
jgi:glycosyltransferase involved in cell wall biosynthesis